MKGFKERYQPLQPTGSQKDFDQVTSGWDAKLMWFLLHSVVDLLWGIALCIFSTGYVPITWVLSEWGKAHPNVIPVITTTLSTAHVKYTFQTSAQMYSKVKVITGFNLEWLKWLQGIMEWSMFTFAGWRRILWFIFVFIPMALHSASIVAILQPADFVMNVWFNEDIPCAIDPSSLSFSFDATPFLTPRQQFGIDFAASSIGRQWGNYYDSVNGNTTTAVRGRIYVKENVTYAAIGGLKNGLHDAPGAEFDASCSRATAKDSEMQIPPSEWTNVFPGRSVPTVQISNDIVLISDSLPIPDSSLQSINTTTNPGVATVYTAFYALVLLNGTGGLMVADADGTVDICTWVASPRTIHVQTVNFTAHAASAEASSNYPPYLGRAVLQTVQGLGEAIATGATLYASDFNNEDPEEVPNNLPPLPQVLQVLLADGAKGFLTGFFGAFILYIKHRTDTPRGLARCNSHNRTIAVHWSFGNANNLGWLAIVLTTATGMFGVGLSIWLARNRRMKKNPLNIANSFLLGRRSDVSGDINKKFPLQLRDGCVTEKI